MAIDIAQVKRLLDSDEPNYAAVARLGAAVLPILARFISGSDERLAAKAASAAGYIDDGRAAEVLSRAVRSPSALVRLAAAGAARTMQAPAVSGLILSLLRDRDQGVRKFAIKAAVARGKNSALLSQVRTIEARDPAPAIRTLARRALEFAQKKRIG